MSTTHTTFTGRLIVATIHILDSSICDPQLEPALYIWGRVTFVLLVVNGATMCILPAITQFVKESLQMYRVARQWRLNQYVNLLVKQGILCLLAYVPV